MKFIHVIHLNCNTNTNKVLFTRIETQLSSTVNEGEQDNGVFSEHDNGVLSEQSSLDQKSLGQNQDLQNADRNLDNENHGDRNQDDENRVDKNSVYTMNQFDRNQFDNNRGDTDRNHGDMNLDDKNHGDRNQGDSSKGDRNLDDVIEGDSYQDDKNVDDGNVDESNHGDRIKGDRNRSDRNQDDRYLDNGNQGDQNQGNKNHGDRNIDDRNRSDKNQCDSNQGDGYINKMNKGDRNHVNSNQDDNSLDDVNQVDGSNQGDGNCGESNQGDGSHGDSNQGDGNQDGSTQGDSNHVDGSHGDSNQGDGNQDGSTQGDSNQVDGSHGDSNQGDGSHGDSNQGDGNQDGSTQGDSNQGDGSHGDSNQGDGNQDGSTQDDSNQVDGSHSDSNQGDGNQDGSTQGDSNHVDGSHGDSNQGDGNQDGSTQGDSNHVDGSHGDSNQGDGNQDGSTQGDSNQVDGSHGDSNQGDGSHGDSSKGDKNSPHGDSNQGGGTQDDMRNHGDINQSDSYQGNRNHSDSNQESYNQSDRKPDDTNICYIVQDDCNQNKINHAVPIQGTYAMHDHQHIERSESVDTPFSSTTQTHELEISEEVLFKDGEQVQNISRGVEEREGTNYETKRHRCNLEEKNTETVCALCGANIMNNTLQNMCTECSDEITIGYDSSWKSGTQSSDHTCTFSQETLVQTSVMESKMLETEDEICTVSSSSNSIDCVIINHNKDPVSLILSNVRSESKMERETSHNNLTPILNVRSTVRDQDHDKRGCEVVTNKTFEKDEVQRVFDESLGISKATSLHSVNNYQIPLCSEEKSIMMVKFDKECLFQYPLEDWLRSVDPFPYANQEDSSDCVVPQMEISLQKSNGEEKDNPEVVPKIHTFHENGIEEDIVHCQGVNNHNPNYHQMQTMNENYRSVSEQCVPLNLEGSLTVETALSQDKCNAIYDIQERWERHPTSSLLFTDTVSLKTVDTSCELFPLATKQRSQHIDIVKTLGSNLADVCSEVLHYNPAKWKGVAKRCKNDIIFKKIERDSGSSQVQSTKVSINERRMQDVDTSEDHFDVLHRMSQECPQDVDILNRWQNVSKRKMLDTESQSLDYSLGLSPTMPSQMCKPMSHFLRWTNDILSKDATDDVLEIENQNLEEECYESSMQFPEDNRFLRNTEKSCFQIRSDDWWSVKQEGSSQRNIYEPEAETKTSPPMQSLSGYKDTERGSTDVNASWMQTTPVNHREPSTRCWSAFLGSKQQDEGLNESFDDQQGAYSEMNEQATCSRYESRNLHLDNDWKMLRGIQEGDPLSRRTFLTQQTSKS